MSIYLLIIEVSKEKEIQMTKTLSVLSLIAHAVAFLVSVYVMVLDEEGNYGYLLVLATFVTLPVTIALVANKLSK